MKRPRLQWAVAQLAIAIASQVLADGQVTGLKVSHRAGQTFITWTDVDQLEIPDDATSSEVKAKQSELVERQIRYHVYRSDRSITSLEGLEPLGSTGPMSCWNYQHYGRNHGRHKQGKAFRWVLDDGGKPVPKGSGIYVHNPRKTGKAYYAVVYSVDGKENSTLSAANATARPVEDTVGQGVPVLQRITRPEKFQYVRGATLRYYVRWEAPPNSSVENRPIDYLVGIPPDVEEPWVVGLHLHCWGGSLNGGYAWWDNNQKGAVLLASNQEPYDWWTGYHENYFSVDRRNREAAFRNGVVRPYSMNRTFSFLDWLATEHEVDLTRTFVAGNSMGGSGAIMCAIRYPERIASCRSWVGVHIPSESPRFKGSYEGVYGKPEWGVKFEDGTPVWDYYNDAWYLKDKPNEEVGFITFCNGKNDGGIGWPQAVEFIGALQATKRPHLFIWGQAGHSERTVYPGNGSQNLNPIDMRVDQSLPAFTKCSLDDDFGTGRRSTEEEMGQETKELAAQGVKADGRKGKPDPFDGDRSGQVNRWLYWQTADVVDTEDSWEITVALMSEAPKDNCTVDITPRRLQKLKAKPGDTFRWTNSSDGKDVQSGAVAADEHGLITLPEVQVGKAKNRITITRQ